jgi:thymidylate synthase (FAD)
MTEIIDIFIASTYIHAYYNADESKKWFIEKIKELDMYVIEDETYLDIEIGEMYNKFYEVCMVRNIDASNYMSNDKIQYFKKRVKSDSNKRFKDKDLDDAIKTAEKILLMFSTMKTKRNAGDYFKHIVTDNWSTELIVTFNLRSLRNYFKLRDSGGAFFQIQWLANEMKKVIPEAYLSLLVK